MGSNFRQDKIGALTEAGGTISLAPSTLTIGGRQLETTSVISLISPSVSAETWYRVYAINNAGTVELRHSVNNNSVGPDGFSSWKLVGHFYSGLSSGIFALSKATIDGKANLLPVRARIWHNVSQSLGDPGAQEVEHSEIDYDSHDIAQSSRRFKLPRDGKYTFHGVLEIDGSGTSFRIQKFIRIASAGGSQLGSKLNAANVNGNSSGDVQATRDLSKGDLIFHTWAQNSGGSRTVVNGPDNTYYEIQSEFPTLIDDEDL